MPSHQEQFKSQYWLSFTNVSHAKGGQRAFVLSSLLVIPRPGEGATETMSALRSHHRDLYKLSISLGGKRYSYDMITCTCTNEVSGEKEWKEHFGSHPGKIWC